MTIGPKMCPSKAAVELAAAEEQKDISSKLSPMVDKIGMVIFVVTMIGLIFSHSSTSHPGGSPLQAVS